ncbi:MAG: HEAT repeat domain-containing protein [Nitrospirae bacterium]|nr:HEAT repeat domain-containing protein [Nitrospirota bacterium]
MTAEEVIKVKHIIQTLLKAKKNIRLYPANNPIYVKTINDTFVVFDEFLNYKDELVLKIKQKEIFYGSDHVYHNPEKENNFAFFFFKDGIRELSFKKGLSKHELEGFLKSIAVDFDREAIEDDIVTLFWEMDFTNIKYIVDESFLTEDEDFETKATNEIKSKVPNVDTFMKAYSDAFNAEDVKETSIINITNEDLHLLAKEKENDLQDKTNKLLKVVLEMILQTESTAELENIYHTLKDLIIYSLENKNLPVFINIIKKAKETAENNVTPDNVKKQINLLLSSVNSEELVRHVCKILESDIDIDENFLNEYTEFLNRNAITPLIVVLGELESIHGRKKVINLLTQVGKKDLQTLAKGLSDSRWYVVRNIVYILRQIGDKRALEYIITAAKHPDIRVRKEVIWALSEFKSSSALVILKDYLNDTDILIRKVAVKALCGIGSVDAREVLLNSVPGKDFLNKELDEKKEFFAALSNWKDPETVNFIIKILKNKTFFKRLRHNENKACAAYSLGLMGNKDALPALYKLKNSKNKLLREHASAAINKIEHGT